MIDFGISFAVIEFPDRLGLLRIRSSPELIMDNRIGVESDVGARQLALRAEKRLWAVRRVHG